MRLFEGVRQRYAPICFENFILTLVLVCGWPLVDGEKNSFLVHGRCIPKLFFLAHSVHFAMTIFDISKKTKQFELLSEAVIILVIIAKVLIRLGIMAFNVKYLTRIVSKIESFVGAIKDEDEKLITERFKKRAERSYLGILILCVVLGFVIAIVPLFDTDKRFPGHITFPFDHAMDCPLYECLYFLTVFIASETAGVVAAGDGFYICIVLYMTGQFKVLQYRLENARKYAERRVERALQDNLRTAKSSGDIMVEEEKLTRSESEDASSITDRDLHSRDRVREILEQSSIRRDVDEQCCSFSRDIDESKHLKGSCSNCSIRDLTMRLQKASCSCNNGGPDTQYQLDIDSAMKEHLTECVLFHEALIGFQHYIENQFNIALFFEYLVIALSIALDMFQIATVPTLSADFFVWVIMFLIHVLVPLAGCWLASELTEETANVADALYFSDWLSTSPSYKRSMLVVMTRAVQPLVTMIGSILPVGMDTYTSIVNSAYSYFNIVKTMHLKNN